MASRVLFISANTCADPYPVFPLGLAHVDAAVRRAGHETEWFDCKFEGASVAAKVAGFQPDYVGISLRNIDDVLIKKRQTFYGSLVTLSEEIRSVARCPVILGGSGYSIFPAQLLALTGAEFGIHGEGELSLVDLLAALESGADYTRIPGLVYRQNGRTIINPKQSGTLAQTVIPAHRPDRIMDYYLQSSGMLNVQTQRGCAHECCYCTYPVIEGGRFRRRPVDAVVEELADLERRGATYFLFVDSIFNSTPEHVAAVGEGILRRGIKLRWGCFMRPTRLTRELMELMARAGLAHIEFGSDSFSDTVLAAYRKGFTFDDIATANALARQTGVDCCHFLICGGPGETPETLQESYLNSRRLEKGIILALVGMRVYPDTELFHRAQREGVVAADADLLPPRYYLSPALTEAAVFAHLNGFARQSPNWIVGDPPPRYLEMAERLRKRGVVGPLWSYFALMQRFAPADAG